MNYLLAKIICTGIAPTVPLTEIELEIKPGELSTIRYEIAEGSLAGTAYIQSVGELSGIINGNKIVYTAGAETTGTRIEMIFDGQKISSAEMSHFISGMVKSLVDCRVDE